MRGEGGCSEAKGRNTQWRKLNAHPCFFRGERNLPASFLPASERATAANRTPALISAPLPPQSGKARGCTQSMLRPVILGHYHHKQHPLVFLPLLREIWGRTQSLTALGSCRPVPRSTWSPWTHHPSHNVPSPRNFCHPHVDILKNLRTPMIKPHLTFLTFCSSSFPPSQACSTSTILETKAPMPFPTC